MKLISYGSLTATLVLSVAANFISSSPAQSQQKPSFTCDTSSGVPATVVQSPQHGTVRIIEWKTTEFGDDFNPQKRCGVVSEKFQQYAQAGTLKYFTTGSVNRQPVICAVASQNAPCNSESMLYTLKQGSNPSETLKQLLDVRSGASSNALNETESRIYIDFEKVVEAKAQSNVTETTENNAEASPLF